MSITQMPRQVLNFPPVRQKGVGLIEVLVALLVLSVGLLGLASLQSHALRFNQGAFLRTQATTLAYDIVDRMRANREQANSTSSYTVAMGSGIPALSTNCEASNCSEADMAAYDLNKWKTALSERLPGGDGAVSFSTVGTSRIYTVTTRWDSRDGGGNIDLQIRSEI